MPSNASRLRGHAHNIIADLCRDDVPFCTDRGIGIGNGWRVVVTIEPDEDTTYGINPAATLEPNDAEMIILQAMGEETLFGEEIARRAQYSFEHTRKLLGVMLRLGFVTWEKNRGFARTRHADEQSS